jgi:Mg2+ and Co2+ transporter CorA
MRSAILFDRDRVKYLEDVSDRPRRLRGSQLLWVDVDRATKKDADLIADAFELDRKTRDCLASSPKDTVFYDRGRYIHVTTYAPDEDCRAH